MHTNTSTVRNRITALCQTNLLHHVHKHTKQYRQYNIHNYVITATLIVSDCPAILCRARLEIQI